MSIYDHMRMNGIDYSGDFIKDGRGHYFTANGDKGKNKGWYYYHQDRLETCVYGHFKIATDQRFVWKAKSDLSPDEERFAKKRFEAIRKQRKREQEAIHLAARLKAAKHLASGQPVIHHAYLTKKKIRAHGLKSKRDWLMIPLYEFEGDLRGLQWITPEGKKLFLKGTEKAGSCFLFGSFDSAKRSKRIIICEGFATGASIFEALDEPVLVAFDSGNLMPVATSIAKNYPTLKIIVAGDDDYETAGNPGRSAADAVALKFDGRAIYPNFEGLDRGTDFNDLAVNGSLEMVKTQINECAAVKQPLNLQRDRQMKPLANANNVTQILHATGGPVYDEFTKSIRHADYERWSDDDDMKLQVKLQREHLPEVNITAVRTGTNVYAHETKRNFVQDFLNSTSWDGTERIDQFLFTAFGVKDDEYTRSVSKNFWLAMVARAFDPGCKFDNMIVLEGHQGLKKSTALQKIVGSPHWFQTLNIEFGSKDFLMSIQGKWLVEVGELQSFNKADILTIKNVLSAQEDTYRPAYGARVVDAKRQCIMVGTTNAQHYLKDDTGGRRFWPVYCQYVDVEMIEQFRMQLFGEALVKYRKGASWWEVPESAKAEQAARLLEDEWLEPIQEYLSRNDAKPGFTVLELSEHLEIDVRHLGPMQRGRIIGCLKRLGYESTDVKIAGQTKKRWVNVSGGSRGQLKMLD